MNGKIYMIILDGAADRSIPELNGMTPLETANKPVLDNFAKNGQQSMILHPSNRVLFYGQENICLNYNMQN